MFYLMESYMILKNNEINPEISTVMSCEIRDVTTADITSEIVVEING